MNFGEHPSVVLRAVTAALRKHDIAPSRFGRDAVNDPRLVADLRKGRTIKPAIIAKVKAHLQTLEAGNA